MRTPIAVSFILLSAAISAPGAIGQEAPLAKVYACADIENAGQRHACFDALVPELKASRSATSRGAAAPARPQQQAETLGRPQARSSPLTAPVKAPEAARTAPVDDKQLDRLNVTVKSIASGNDGKYRFAMDNGQVWKQVDTESLRNLGSGPWIAEIRTASLGSFMLKLAGQSRSIRVSRIQ